MVLTFYCDTISQPCRSVLLFLKVNEIPFELKTLELFKGEHKSAEMQKIHPQGSLPFIDDDGFLLNESIAIIEYLATKFKVADHWYPADVKKRARVHQALFWHNSGGRSIRHFGSGLVMNKVFLQHLGMSKATDEEKFKKDSEGFHSIVKDLEEMFLKDNAFVTGNDITIADLMIASELVQPKFCDIDVLSSHTKTVELLERVRQKCNPYWDEIIAECKARCDGYIAGLGK